MYCVALDPGGTTGVATVPNADEPWVIEPRQFEGEHHATLLSYLEFSRPETIIAESFYRTANEAARLASSEIIGVVKAYAQATATPVVWQSPSTGKGFWSDLRLKKCGLYVVGKPHARDAIRHYAYWRTFTLKDSSLLAKTGESGPEGPHPFLDD